MQSFLTFLRQLMTQILQWKMFMWQQNMLPVKLWANKWHKWHKRPSHFLKVITSRQTWNEPEENAWGLQSTLAQSKNVTTIKLYGERGEATILHTVKKTMDLFYRKSYMSCGQVQHHLWGPLNRGMNQTMALFESKALIVTF